MDLYVVYSLIHIFIHPCEVLQDRENEDSVTLTLFGETPALRGKILFTGNLIALRPAV